MGSLSALDISTVLTRGSSMARALSENQVAHDLGVSLQERLVRGVIRGIQSLRDESQLSGEFSGLGSVWEEICVQQ